MVAVEYRHWSVRARKARLAKRLGNGTNLAEGALLGILVAATIYLLLTKQPIGYATLGLGLLVGMVTIWHHWDLNDLKTNPRALMAPTVPLHNAVEARLLSRLRPQMDGAQLYIEATHLWEAVFVIQRSSVPPALIRDTLAQAQVSSDMIWDGAIALARDLNTGEIDAGMVAAACLLSVPQIQPILAHLKIKPEDVVSVLSWQQRAKREMAELKTAPYYGGVGRDWAQGYTPLLNKFASNMSREIENGYYSHIPTVHEAVIDNLLQRVAENKPVVLVGGVGSGRTAVVYAMAERIMRADRVGGLQYYQVMSLNASSLLSATSKLEDLVLNLLGESVQARNTILFLDEAQLFFNEGTGSIDLSAVLLPILQHNSIKLIMTMSDHDWQALTARQPGVTAALQRLIVPEPSPEETLIVLQDAAIGIEHKAQATTTQAAITESIRLAGRYLPEMAFPGKAITVLESASHNVQDGLITADSVQQAIQATTGAKVTTASQPEREQLLKLEDQIHQRMINQVRAVKVVSDALRRSRAGVGSAKRPVGSFLFLGPTGVGKTELAKALAAIYFGGEQSMIRLDMSEYQQASDVARLLTPSSGTEAGATLLSAVRQNPSSVVLLDEIEKAHPDILNLLLQVLDEGRLTDSDGRVVSFRDAIVIATSNAAADEIRDRIAKGEELEAFEAEITEGLISSHQFKPELLNRFDEIVVFRPLTKPELRQVVALMVAEVNVTLAEQNVVVALTDAAADWLVEHGYDPALGARPLRRMVQRTVENSVAERLLAGDITPGQTITFDAKDLVAATE